MTVCIHNKVHMQSSKVDLIKNKLYEIDLNDLLQKMV